MEKETRYFVDIRNGCAAIRDRQHPKYDKEYPGLHSDTIDVVEYKHGLQLSDGWKMNQLDIDYLKQKCEELNGCPMQLNMENIKPETILEKHWNTVTDKPFCDMTLSHLNYVILSMREYAQLISSERTTELQREVEKLREAMNQIWKLSPPDSTIEIICNEALNKLTP